MKEIQIISINPFAGRKNIVFCEGKGQDDPNCLERNPPNGMRMIYGNMCGAGCDKFGSCKAVFADPNENPELFETVNPTYKSR